MSRANDLRLLIINSPELCELDVPTQVRPRIFVCIGIILAKGMNDEEVLDLIDQATREVQRGSWRLRQRGAYPIVHKLYELLIADCPRLD